MRLLLSFAVCLTVLAGALPSGAESSRSPVTWLRDPDHVAGDVVPGVVSDLVIDCQGVWMGIYTEMLRPREAHTVWWVIFNSPDHCAVPFECTSADLENPAVQGSVQYATGNVVSRSGTAYFEAEVVIGELWGCQPPALGLPCNGLLTPHVASIHLVVRNQGPPIAGLVHEQTGTFAGGCNGPAPPFLPGGNDCFDAQVSVHLPPPPLPDGAFSCGIDH